jgi:cellulose synthase/poly-beta-1,6-N-acetylglucosamine synthase-like glycosyltransferase
MTKPTLTIVIPAYNEELRIGACLESIRDQTVKPDKVLVVDNNSTDSTAEIAGSFSFSTVIDESAQGISNAHKKGFNSAGTDLIVRIDADCTLPDDFVEKIHNFYANPDHSLMCIRGSGIANNIKTRRLNYLLGLLAFRSTDVVVGHSALWGPCMVIPNACWHAVKEGLCIEKGHTFDDLDLSLHVTESGFVTHCLKELQVNIELRHIYSLKSFIVYNLRLPRTLKHHGNKRWLFAYSISILSILIYPLLFILRKPR